MRQIKTLINRGATLTWTMFAFVSVIVSQLVMGWLNNLYAETQFPVSFFEGQTTFSGPLIKSYYEELLRLNTFEAYVFVQWADYLFMLTVLLSHFLAMVWLYRLQQQGSIWQTLALIMIYVAPSAAFFDALENAISFIMLANPTDFPDWIAIPYSAFACLKFFVFGLTYLWVLTGALTAIINRIINSKS